MDPDLDRLSNIIVDYSTRVKEGDRVLIVSYGLDGRPLVKSLYKKCIQRGACHVEYLLRDPSILRDFLAVANERQLSYIPSDYLTIIQNIDVYIWLGAPNNTRELALVDGKKDALHKKAIAPLREERLKRTRWFALLYPTQGLAQDANMSLEELSTFFYEACLKDWTKEKEKMLPLKELLEKTKLVRVIGQDTDLSLETGKRSPVCCAGEVNLPDGEIFVGPELKSARGIIRFNMPAMYQGKVFYEVELEFKEGMVIRESSRNEAPELTKILDTDEGSRYLGEFAIGLNHQINRQFFNPLFDEKIFGTIHIALGHCFPQSDNGNRSGIHWDLIYSLRGRGQLFFDDDLIMEDGTFVHETLKHLNPEEEKDIYGKGGAEV